MRKIKDNLGPHTHNMTKKALISTNKTFTQSDINLLDSNAYDYRKKCVPGESGKNEPMQQGRGWREN